MSHAEAAAEPFQFRPYKESDVNFILNSWGSSYYKGAQYHDFLSPEEFHHYHRPLREQLLHRPSATVIICCAKENEDLILGWILVEKPKGRGLILHYIYVKEAFKGEKIASQLISRALPERPVMVSHLTERARKLMRLNPQKYKEFFNAPHLI